MQIFGELDERASHWFPTLRGLRPRFPLTAGWSHTFDDLTPSSIVSFAGSNAFTADGAPSARCGVVERARGFRHRP